MGDDHPGGCHGGPADARNGEELLGTVSQVDPYEGRALLCNLEMGVVKVPGSLHLGIAELAE